MKVICAWKKQLIEYFAGVQMSIWKSPKRYIHPKSDNWINNIVCDMRSSAVVWQWRVWGHCILTSYTCNQRSWSLCNVIKLSSLVWNVMFISSVYWHHILEMTHIHSDIPTQEALIISLLIIMRWFGFQWASRPSTHTSLSTSSWLASCCHGNGHLCLCVLCVIATQKGLCGIWVVTV